MPFPWMQLFPGFDFPTPFLDLSGFFICFVKFGFGVEFIYVGFGSKFYFDTLEIPWPELFRIRIPFFPCIDLFIFLFVDRTDFGLNLYLDLYVIFLRNIFNEKIRYFVGISLIII